MKLEAEDKHNACVCVATIVGIRNGRLKINYDGWGKQYDFWADPWSPLLHSVGWCQEYGVPLSPPNGGFYEP